MGAKWVEEPKRWSPADSKLVLATQLGMDSWLKEHSGLKERGLWSWLKNSLVSRCPGLPRKPLWGRGRPQASGMHEDWEQPSFLQDVTGQTAQDCPPFLHLHSHDRHPWPHQTDPHLKGFQLGERVP